MRPRRAGARLEPLALLFSLLLMLALAPLARADDPAIEPPTGYVNDRAGVMDEPSRAKLEAFLDQVQQKTGAQFAVLTVKSTAPLTPTEYKTRVFEAWGIGGKEKDEGLLMLVAMEEHEVRFETGYGLEGTLPDGFESRVVRREMAPRMRAGDVAGAITAGMLACAARLAHERGVVLEWDGSELRYGRDEGGMPPLLLLGLVGLMLLFILIAARSSGYRGRRRGGWYGGGFGGGYGGFGGGGGFGGFSGGGGGGGSFGGFGGGSSGGGGGGGSW